MRNRTGTHLLPAVLCVLFMISLMAGNAVFAEEKGDEAPAAEATAEADGAEKAEEEAPAAEEETASGRDWIHGRFDADFDGAWSDHDSDMNLNQTLQLGIDPPAHERIHLRGLLWMHEDLDSDERMGSALRDINDTWDSDIRARLLHLYLDIDDIASDSVLRIGRQRIIEGAAYNRIDGVYFRQQRPHWQWYLFGGLRASIYDDDAEEPVLGGGALFSPFRKTRIGLDLCYGEEHRDGDDIVYYPVTNGFLHTPWVRRVDQDISNTQISLSLWQELTQNMFLFGRFDWYDGEGNEIRIDLTGHFDSIGLSYQLAWRRQFGNAGDRIREMTTFYRVLGELEEYDVFLVSLQKSLTKRLALALEGEFRDSDNDDFEWSTANRDYNRYALILTATPLVRKVEASLALEKWDIDGGESSWTVSGELSRKWKDVTLTIGADYERYEDRFSVYNPVPLRLNNILTVLVPGLYPGATPRVVLFDEWVLETHEDIYSVYARVKWAFHENQELSASIVREEDDGPDSPYWRLRAGYSIRF